MQTSSSLPLRTSRPPTISDAEYHRRLQRQLARMPPEARKRALQTAAFGQLASKTLQPMLPLEAMPVIVRDFGITEAHVRPLAGCRRADDSIHAWRTSPVRAWLQPLLEWTRTGCSYVALAFDIDGQEALEHLASANIGTAEIPCPNIAAYRRTSSNAHAIYTLRRPVFRGENVRPFPLAVLGRISEWLREALHADAGFSGVLVANPTHADYDTVWLKRDAYTLDDLRAYIPGNWRRPKVPRTDVGRNNDIFRALLRYAGNAAHSDADVARHADALYQTIDVTSPHAFTAAELAGVVRSVLRYRQIWRDRGWHKPAWVASRAKAGRANRREQQQAKGRTGGIRSGEARRAGTPLEHDRAPWASMAVSRRTWYRHHRHDSEVSHEATTQPATPLKNRRSEVGTEATTQDVPDVPAKPAT